MFQNKDTRKKTCSNEIKEKLFDPIYNCCLMFSRGWERVHWEQMGLKT